MSDQDKTHEFEENVRNALRAPRNVGELDQADAVGTVGSADCGDMLRMWFKFREDGSGRKVIDKATFQSFGCETAIAVASMATEMLEGKTPEEALALSGEQLSEPLGALPPMKIHCAQLVEGALRSALGGGDGDDVAPSPSSAAGSATLLGQMQSSAPAKGKIKIRRVSGENPE